MYHLKAVQPNLSKQKGYDMKSFFNSLGRYLINLAVLPLYLLGFMYLSRKVRQKYKGGETPPDLKELVLDNMASRQALDAFNRIKFLCGSKEMHHRIQGSKDTEFTAYVKGGGGHEYVIWAAVRILSARKSVWIHILHVEDMGRQDMFLLESFKKLCADHYWSVTEGVSKDQPKEKELLSLFSWEKEQEGEPYHVHGESPL